jgi:cell division protein FtsX
LRRPFTFSFTLIGLVLCLLHYFYHEFEPIYLLFYSLSVPAWFVSVTPLVYNNSLWTILTVYFLTIVTWALVGYVIDRYSEVYQRRKRA